VTTISDALNDLLSRRVPLDEAINRHFVATYRQRTDGAWDDRAGFADHIAHLRSFISSVQVTVLEELASGATYAERHIVRLQKDDGATIEQEVYVFGDQDETGRFSRIEETTLMLHGVEGDRGVGRAKA
jgi:hypothetical protein